MDVPIFRLLPLVLLLLPAPFREYLSSSYKANHVRTSDLHPIILLPGYSCSNLEARLTDEYQPSVPHCSTMKGKGWFGLWENSSELVTHDYVQCFEEQMRLVFDPTINDYRNLPGVETRVPNFGSATGFQSKNPAERELCLAKLRDALEGIGYRAGETLFGAPYDIRHVPPVPGQTSQVYSRYFQQLTELIEDVSRRRNGTKVILFGHSYGGFVSLEFVRSTPLAWRNRYIKHLFVAAPTLYQGFVGPVKNLVSGPDMFYIPTATGLSLRQMWWSFEGAIMFLPSIQVFGHRPLVVTKQRNYSAYDLEDLLVAIGFSDAGVQTFRKRALPRMNNFVAPLVPVTCFNGVGIKTPQKLVYWDHDFDVPPQVVYGDGDGRINLIGMLAFDEEMRQNPGQRPQYRSIKFDKANHDTILTEDWALGRVIHEIIEANGFSSSTQVSFTS